MGLATGSGADVGVGVGREGSGASSGTALRIMFRRSVLIRTGGAGEMGAGADAEAAGVGGWLVRGRATVVELEEEELRR